jgi:phospholipase/carboxylesterase
VERRVASTQDNAAFGQRKGVMTEEPSAALLCLLQPLLHALDRLIFVQRHLHPPDFGALMASVGEPDDALQAAKAKRPEWPPALAPVAGRLQAASEAALQAFAGLRSVLRNEGDIRSAYRALCWVPQALETLYPLANRLSPVNQFFLDPTLRTDPELQRLLLQAPSREDTGLLHFGAAERGGFWLYVPEHYRCDVAWPLVMALHGGSSTGRQFLWTWLRDARSRGAILVAPTSVGSTWALLGPDADTPNLCRAIERIRSRWNVDATRLLLTGMSDGGTFTYLSGLGTQSPFTHLAPVAAAFHPMLAELADPDRLHGLPIHIVHGTLDWMFPLELAQQAHAALASAGAAVTLREVDDLSHTYPRELNAAVLRWVAATARTSAAPSS